MKSFDFYDTLFTRLVAEPSGIFQLMEELLNEPGFTRRRIAAEQAARRAAKGKEVNIEAIYDQLSLAPNGRSEAMALELQLERKLMAPIVGNLDRLDDTDLVVSDMYLPGSLLRSIIADYRGLAAPLTVMVSNEIGSRKSDGTLWRHLRQRYPGLRSHVGDSPKGDVWRPRLAGLQAEHFRKAELNCYERQYLKLGSLDGLLIAGLSRAARLSAPTAKHDKARFESVDEVFSSVVSPILVAFVEHVIEDATHCGIDQLYFLARDGQLLHRIADRIIASRGLPLRAHYIYGSRHAVHLPGLTTLDLAQSWLLEDTPHLSLAEIAGRGELPESVVCNVGRRFGFTDFHQNIPYAKRGDLKQVIQAPEIVARLRENSNAKWQMAFDYYAQAGLRPGMRLALIDVGWTGRMQASLRAILDRAGNSPVALRGYYLCLSSKLTASANDVLSGFLHDPDTAVAPCAFDPYRSVVEASLMADHGTTLGFERIGAAIHPILGEPPAPETTEVVNWQQAAVLRFVESMLRLENVRGRRISWPRNIVAENLLLMCQQPRNCDANAFAAREFSEGQAGQLKRQVVRQVTPGFDWLRRQALGLWPEGSLTFSGGRSVLAFVRAARWLKSRVLA